MATTSATGNQGSTGDQDPEPQQEILATAAGIRSPATARAGDAGRRLVREDMAQDQAHRGRAPVHLDGNRGRANRGRRAARHGGRQARQAHQDAETDQDGGPGGEYESYQDHQAQDAAENAEVQQDAHKAQERRKPAVEADLGGLFAFHQDDTGDAAPVFVQEPGAGFDNAEPAPAVVVVIPEAANRPGDKGRNSEDKTAERRRPRPVYPKTRDPETPEAARRMGVRSGEVRRLGPHIQRPKLPKLNARPEKPKRPPLWFRPPRLPGVKGP